MVNVIYFFSGHPQPRSHETNFRMRKFAEQTLTGQGQVGANLAQKPDLT